MGEIKQNQNKKTEKTCSTIQRQHIRTRFSSRTLLLVRIASAMARAPSASMSLPSCEIMRMRGRDGGIQQNKNKTENNLTRFSIFSLRISPNFMRAASATQSASVTSQQAASISSQSTSNFLQPNFTLAMESRGCSCWPCAALMESRGCSCWPCAAPQ
jgi:hypothetical protein